MGGKHDDVCNMTLRLTPAEARRLERLARETGRKPAGVLRELLRVSDGETVQRIKSAFYTPQGEAFDAEL